MELLCMFNLLMRVPSRNGEQLISIRALLPSDTKEMRWPNREGETERVVRTEFTDMFPPDMVGLVIAYLHQMVGGERARAEFVRSVAIMLLVRGVVKAEKGNVFVELGKQYRRIVRTVSAVEGSVSLIRRCLGAVEECVIFAKRVHYFTTDCKREVEGCGRTTCVGIRAGARLDYEYRSGSVSRLTWKMQLRPAV